MRIKSESDLIQSKELNLIDDRITTGNKVSFGIAGTGVALLSGVINGPLGIFYHDKLGLEAGYVSVAMLIFAFWNAINDPIFGILEERTQSKLGRRIPYLRYGAPFFGLAFIVSWFPFFGSSQLGMFFNFLLALFLLDTMYTLIGLITYSLPSEMCITQKGRTELQVYSVYFGAIGAVASMIIALVFFTEGTAELSPVFKPAMIAIGIIGALLIFLSSFNLVENKYAMHEKPLGFLESFKTAFKNKAFLIFEGNAFFYQIAWIILTGMTTYYIRDVMQFSGFMATVPFLLILGMVFLLSGPFSIVVKKFGLKKTYIAGLISAIISYIILFFLSVNQWTAMIGLVFVGFSFAPLTLCSGPMMFDIIDQDEILTGKRRETTYAGMNAIFTKPAISVAQAVFILVIDAMGFSKAKLDQGLEQSAATQLGIRIAFCLIPAAVLLISLIFIKSFPLDGEKWHKKKLELNQIHLTKEKEYLQQLQEEAVNDHEKA